MIDVGKVQVRSERMLDMRDAVKFRRNSGMDGLQDRREMRDTTQEERWTEEMWDKGHEGCSKGQDGYEFGKGAIAGMRDTGKEGCWREGMQARRDKGHEGCRTGGMQKYCNC